MSPIVMFRAAFVAVLFSDNEAGHALNAFRTTDRGLVYVDCTGRGFESLTFEERVYEQRYPAELDKHPDVFPHNST